MTIAQLRRSGQVLPAYSTKETISPRGVAQLDSAFGLGPKGRKFESSHPDHRRVGSSPTNDYRETIIIVDSGTCLVARVS